VSKRPVDQLRHDRYFEDELSGDGKGGEYESGYRKGWNDSSRHAESALLGARKSIELVAEFHRAFGQPDADVPRVADDKVNDLRISLLDEELEELCTALRRRDPIAALDALTDLQYVLDGAYLQLGFAHVKDAALAEVHRSNMSKLGGDGKPVYRADGKIMKGPNYSPPNLVAVLAKRERISAFARALDEQFDTSEGGDV
jgi:predicted HAD superfamily Cof-like phosphohydrolase